MRNLLKVSLLSLTLAACDCGGPIQRPSQGELKVDENSLDFGAACPRPTSDELKVEEVVRTVHVHNVGRGALTINKFEVEEGKKNLFVFDTSKIPGELDSLTDLEVPITFVPNGPGTVIADLTIQGDEEGKEPVVVKLIGEGKSAPPNPGVVVSCRGGKFDNNVDNPNDTCAERDPASNLEKLRENANFFFRDAPVGEVSLATFKLRNTGCPTLEVSNIAVSTDTSNGADAAYALNDGQKTSLAVINGAELEITVAFNPKIADKYDGELTFTTNDPAMKNVSIPLQGLGIEPQIVANPASCDFRLFGAGACNGKFTLSNSGEQALTLGEIFIEGANANPDAPSNFRLTGKPAAGTSIPAFTNNQLVDAVLVEYTPHLDAPINDYLVINSSGGQARVLLRGGSFPVLATEPEFEIDFGTNLDASKTHYRPLIVRNFATWAKQLPLTVKRIGTENAPTGRFVLERDPANGTACPAPIAPNTQIATGQSETVCVAFKPPSIGGDYQEDFVIESDDPLWSTSPYRVTMKASAGCNAFPVAEVTVPTATTCGGGQNCNSTEKCISGICHATGNSITHNLSAGHELELSCAAAHDLIADANGQCVVPDPSKIASCNWELISKPSGSTSSLDPAGRTPQRFTKLKIDPARTGIHVIRLNVRDDTGADSTSSATFNVNVQP